MELLMQMIAWTMFCLVVLPASIAAAIIGLVKLAKRPRPPRPPAAQAYVPGVIPRWTGTSKRHARQLQDAWDRDFRKVDGA